MRVRGLDRLRHRVTFGHATDAQQVFRCSLPTLHFFRPVRACRALFHSCRSFRVWCMVRKLATAASRSIRCPTCGRGQVKRHTRDELSQASRATCMRQIDLNGIACVAAQSLASAPPKTSRYSPATSVVRADSSSCVHPHCWQHGLDLLDVFLASLPPRLAFLWRRAFDGGWKVAGRAWLCLRLHRSRCIGLAPAHHR